MSKLLFKDTTKINAPLDFRIDSIQSLRAIAALAVVCGHAAFFRRGTFGVDIFFVVSGFIMMYITQTTSSGFFIKRLIRIIPLYWFATLLYTISIAPLTGQNFSIFKLLESLLFLPDLACGTVQPILAVGWTLNHEIVFYVLFAVSMKISMKHRGLLVSIFLLIWTAIIYQFETLYCSRTIPLEFTLGIAAFYIIRHEYSVNKGALRNIICLIVAVSSAWFMVSKIAMTPIFLMGEGTALLRPVVLGIPAMLFVCAWCILFINAKTPKTLIFLGNISYSMYILHTFVIYFTKKLLIKIGIFEINTDFFAFNYKNLLFMMLVAGITIGISSISYNNIEVKLTRKLRSHFASKI